MEHFQLLAHPLWVNLFVLLPIALYFVWRSTGIHISVQTLFVAAMFAIAFGFVEATVVVYLRGAAGPVLSDAATALEVHQLATTSLHDPATVSYFPQNLLTVEMVREGATIIMLVSIALLTVASAKERLAVFLWTFAVWDISYYAGLCVTIRWPASLEDLDTLFLIPVPWLAQVWYPLLVSSLTVVMVGVSRRARTPVSAT